MTHYDSAAVGRLGPAEVPRAIPLPDDASRSASQAQIQGAPSISMVCPFTRGKTLRHTCLVQDAVSITLQCGA